LSQVVNVHVTLLPVCLQVEKLVEVGAECLVMIVADNKSHVSGSVRGQDFIQERMDVDVQLVAYCSGRLISTNPTILLEGNPSAVRLLNLKTAGSQLSMPSTIMITLLACDYIT
jgi:hypothetical protein